MVFIIYMGYRPGLEKPVQRIFHFLCQADKKMRYFAFILAVLLLTVSCRKNKVKGGSNVEFYLLKDNQPLGGSCKVDGSIAVLQETPLLTNDDIIQYTRSNYKYSLTISGVTKVKVLKGRTPFAITVDKEIIFYAVYMPAYLSSTCFESITMDLDWTVSNNIVMNLGYPGSLTGTVIDDRRNNAKLLATLSGQGKLR